VPPDPERLFAQADALAAQPHQEDLRRAISTAYYGLFHFVLTAAADMVVGDDRRSTRQYGLAYRSVDHSSLRKLCSQLSGTRPQNVALVPSGGFGTIADFARISGNLYELRNLADYDPSRTFTPEEARVAISDARHAISRFRAGSKEQQEGFLTLVLFKSR
jgi:uncharacterized protein (UPF0332 family)